jgi:predicted TIM-barrel fold metal-dependent hydrolase
MQGVDAAIVFGIQSLALKMHTPNDAIAEYVKSHSDKMIGFMSIDPNAPDALDELERCHKTLGLRGIKMSPVYQDYHPCDEKARRVHRRAEQLGLPILTHSAFQSISATRMEWANPLLYDPVAREFPNLRIIMAHIGLPWFQDAMVMVYKHKHIYADVSPAMHHGWLYQALATFQEFRVMHKLLFGSDFPVGTPEHVQTSLKNINQSVSGTGLAKIDSGLIDELIHRDSLSLLGLR